jgi:cytochrome c-type biogenesis protein CcmH/NrfF
VRRALAAALATALVVAAAAAASETRPTLSELEREVVCPTCRTTLDQSNAPVAERMRDFILRRIAAGDTKSEIKAKLVAEFGPDVVQPAPPKEGFGLVAWVLPLAGGLAAAVVLGVLAVRWARRREPASEDEEAPLDPGLERRLDDELARFET